MGYRDRDETQTTMWTIESDEFMSRPHQRGCKFRPEITCRMRRFSDGFPPVSPPFDQLLRNGTQLDRARSVATFSFSVFANTSGIYRVPTRSSTLWSICSAEYKGALIRASVCVLPVCDGSSSLSPLPPTTRVVDAALPRLRTSSTWLVVSATSQFLRTGATQSAKLDVSDMHMKSTYHPTVWNYAIHFQK